MLEHEPTVGDDTGNAPESQAADNTTHVRHTRRRASRAATGGVEAGETTSAADSGEGAAEPVRRRRRAAIAEQADNNGVSPTEGMKAGESPPAPADNQRGANGDGNDAAEGPVATPPRTGGGRRRGASAATRVLFVAPAGPSRAAAAQPGEVAGEAAEGARPRRRTRRGGEAEPVEEAVAAAEADVAGAEEEVEPSGAGARRRRRRGRRGRGRGKGTYDTDEENGEPEEGEPPAAEEEEPAEAGEAEQLTRRRRRRRRGAGGGGGGGAGGEAETTTEDGVVTVVKIREPRAARDEVQGLSGSTRLEAKRQRRRDGREQRRTRPQILSESEFLARREAVDRVMVVRQQGERTQVAVLEDGVLVEHYVTRQSAATMVGNVYLGKVQNVLPSMEAAFVDVGRGRNAVLYAGEVNWDASGLEGRARSIEQALRSGDSVLVQVTKDPVGHKGARLTSHVALSGRHLVYVPNGNTSGISRKLSDVERKRLRDVLKNLVPEGAGVIVRTAAEGATAEDLARDVKRLQAQWEDIQNRSGAGGAPTLLYSEPDLVIRVVRDLFNEDFRELVIQGSEAYEEVEGYLSHVAPDLVPRVRRFTGNTDAFAQWRIDEQILKGLDRRVYLPSGGHLVIDRTEAMTVVDVNTGKYTGAGGNLEETVTRNNLEAAEEIVRQVRLRDIGGIVVIDFIDMVLESNRELVLRRLTECLGRDRTKHQVTEITSLGLVQMTRKRIGQGLLEAFSEVCEQCKGRGVVVHAESVGGRTRPNGGEKVKTKAATAAGQGEADGRGGAAQPADVVEGEGEGEGEGEEASVGEAYQVDQHAGALDELATEDIDSDQASAAGGRRRTRRGGTRRRNQP